MKQLRAEADGDIPTIPKWSQEMDTKTSLICVGGNNWSLGLKALVFSNLRIPEVGPPLGPCLFDAIWIWFQIISPPKSNGILWYTVVYCYRKNGTTQPSQTGGLQRRPRTDGSITSSICRRWIDMRHHRKIQKADDSK